jgi:biopolymer transport protein ExbD
MALESAASDKVALAAIEPDPKAGTVTISGDGKDYLAALSYVLNLSRTEGLERVQLVRHEQKNEGNGAVSFAVSAGWAAK